MNIIFKKLLPLNLLAKLDCPRVVSEESDTLLLLQLGDVLVLGVVDGHERGREALAVDGVVALEAHEQHLAGGNNLRRHLSGRIGG